MASKLRFSISHRKPPKRKPAAVTKGDADRVRKLPPKKKRK